MPDHLKNAVLLVGAGRMAKEYVMVLRKMQRQVVVVGRSAQTARRFEQEMGIAVHSGGIGSWLGQGREEIPYEAAIVATSAEQLTSSTLALLRHGAKKILIEKPGGLNEGELTRLASESAYRKAEVYVAYNRRFYASVLAAKRWISADGGVQSIYFDFTEWSERISRSSLPREVLSSWLLANSSHVIDLAFYFGGSPQTLYPLSAGGLAWHPRASRFSGAGMTQEGVLFSYHANWEAPGSWGLELATAKRKLILRPLEQLGIQRQESHQIEPVELSDSLDQHFKPGLYRLVSSFLHADAPRPLPTIMEQLQRYRDVYAPMTGV